MARRIARAGVQLIVLLTLLLFLVFFLDSRYQVLPTAIHNHLPAHHPGLVITDITVRTCSFTSCKLDPLQWLRIEKDLYLGTGLISKAYVHVQRKKEEDLTEEDRVVVDVKIGRLDPSLKEEADGAAKEKGVVWEKREAGLWLKRSSKKKDSDSKQVVTAVDVLFGSDAVDPRPGWTLSGIHLLGPGEQNEARLSIRHGTPSKVEKPIPKVNKNGKFKIMQISDLHLSTGLGKCREPFPLVIGDEKRCEADPRTCECVTQQLDLEAPDLVVLSGDQVNGETAPDAQSAVFKIADILATRKIPYAAIFGNHDDEGNLNRLEMAQVLETLPYSLTTPGPNTIPGVGNYYVEVMSHSGAHSALTLYLLDSHSYSPDEKKFRGYDWIKPEQISWFKDTAASLRADHAKYSHIHLDMAFIHIPLPEYRETGMGPMKGENREGVTAPGYNSGFRDALVEVGVGVVSCGHDHANEYCLLSDKERRQAPALLKKRDGNEEEKEETEEEKAKKAKQKAAEEYAKTAQEAIASRTAAVAAALAAAATHSPQLSTHQADTKLWMCYAGGSGFGGYGGYNGYVRRVRLFEFDANEGRITTWKKIEWEKGLSQKEVLHKKLDEQIVVDRGRVVNDVQ